MTGSLQSGSLRPRMAAHNPRQARLAIEYTNLLNLASRSDLIVIEPIDVHPGWPPEKYLVTYTCHGIIGIEEDGAPKYGDYHQVKMYLPSDYPLREPHLKWVTPIWHPNIDHEVPHHVCTNTAQNYFAGKPLSDLVRAMGEMVQYVRYHAEWAPPYPLDRAAAKWVVEYAEPRGILSKTKPVDDRPLLRPQRVRLFGAAAELKEEPQPKRRRIKLGSASLAEPAVPIGSEDKTRTLAVKPSPSTAMNVLRVISGAFERMGVPNILLGSTCSACGLALPRRGRFCPFCGATTMNKPAACQNCFSPSLPPNARFCPRCGVPVPAVKTGL